MTNKLQSDYGKNNNLAAVLRNNNERIGYEIHVADLCLVSEIITEFNGTYGEARIEKICLDNNEIAHGRLGYFFYNSPAVGDLVMCVITDTDFRDAIKQSPIKPIQITGKTRHSESFGIIIKLQ